MKKLYKFVNNFETGKISFALQILRVNMQRFRIIILQVYLDLCRNT